MEALTQLKGLPSARREIIKMELLKFFTRPPISIKINKNFAPDPHYSQAYKNHG